VVSRFSALAAAAGVGAMVATLADGGRRPELLFVVAALVVGLTIQHLIGQLRRRTRDVASVVRAVREVGHRRGRAGRPRRRLPGGGIAVDSQIGSGTTITAFLPMTVATT